MFIHSTTTTTPRRQPQRPPAVFSSYSQPAIPPPRRGGGQYGGTSTPTTSSSTDVAPAPAAATVNNTSFSGGISAKLLVLPTEANYGQSHILAQGTDSTITLFHDTPTGYTMVEVSDQPTLGKVLLLCRYPFHFITSVSSAKTRRGIAVEIAERETALGTHPSEEVERRMGIQVPTTLLQLSFSDPVAREKVMSILQRQLKQEIEMCRQETTIMAASNHLNTSTPHGRGGQQPPPPPGQFDTLLSTVRKLQDTTRNVLTDLRAEDEALCAGRGPFFGVEGAGGNSAPNTMGRGLGYGGMDQQENLQGWAFNQLKKRSDLLDAEQELKQIQQRRALRKITIDDPPMDVSSSHVAGGGALAPAAAVSSRTMNLGDNYSNSSDGGGGSVVHQQRGTLTPPQLSGRGGPPSVMVSNQPQILVPSASRGSNQGAFGSPEHGRRTSCPHCQRPADEQHIKSCVYRQVRCKKCGLLISMIERRLHEEVCREVSSQNIGGPRRVSSSPTFGHHEKVGHPDFHNHHQQQQQQHQQRLSSTASSVSSESSFSTVVSQGRGSSVVSGSQGGSPPTSPTSGSRRVKFVEPVFRGKGIIPVDRQFGRNKRQQQDPSQPQPSPLRRRTAHPLPAAEESGDGCCPHCFKPARPEHFKQCALRSFACKRCGQEVTMRDKARHDEVCRTQRPSQR